MRAADFKKRGLLAVEATVVCAGASPGQLRKRLSGYVDLPTGDAAALAYLESNGSRWLWNPAAGKFLPMTGK